MDGLGMKPRWHEESPDVSTLSCPAKGGASAAAVGSQLSEKLSMAKSTSHCQAPKGM